MSEERIELRHTKTVMRQSQDETWSYETRTKTRHECVETESRLRRVNMSRDVSRRDTCLETPSLPLTLSQFWDHTPRVKAPYPHRLTRFIGPCTFNWSFGARAEFCFFFTMPFSLGITVSVICTVKFCNI